jgi:hypothetical protein
MGRLRHGFAVLNITWHKRSIIALFLPFYSFIYLPRIRRVESQPLFVGLRDT